MINEKTIYKMFAQYDKRIYLVPEDDVLQTIRAGIIESGCFDYEKGYIKVSYNVQIIRHCMRMIHRLLVDYGYSRNPHRKTLQCGGKELNFQVEPHDSCRCGYNSVMPELCECSALTDDEKFLIKEFEILYKSHTTREIANIFDIEYTDKFRRALNELFRCPTGHRGGGKPARRKYRKEMPHVQLS